MDVLDRALDGREEVLIQQLMECGFSLYTAQQFLPALILALRGNLVYLDAAWEKLSADTFTNLVSYRINHHQLALDAGVLDEQAYAGLAVVIPDIILSLQSAKLRVH